MLCDRFRYTFNTNIHLGKQRNLPKTGTPPTHGSTKNIFHIICMFTFLYVLVTQDWYVEEN